MSAVAAGLLVGAGAALLYLALGRIAGVSGMLGALFEGSPRDNAWRWAYLAGMLLAGVVAARIHADAITPAPGSPLRQALAGLLVGFGARLANGCTSGHALIGVGRLSARSLVAATLFFSVGALTVAGVR